MQTVTRDMTRYRKTFYHAVGDVQDVRVKRPKENETDEYKVDATRTEKGMIIKTVREAKSERLQEAVVDNLTENETDEYKVDATRIETGMIIKYKMDAIPRGICLIIDNRDFTDERLSRRDGTDKNKMEKFFRRLDFEVRISENQTDSDMLEELKGISSLDHRRYDCFVCFILSHGEHGSVYGSNGKAVSVEKIKHFFHAESCTFLAKKPKLFFVEASQGRRPVYEGPDFLTVFDTTPDFISKLTEELDRNPGISLLDIITMVANKMDEVTEPKQIPMFRSTLKKQIILN